MCGAKQSASQSKATLVLSKNPGGCFHSASRSEATLVVEQKSGPLLPLRFAKRSDARRGAKTRAVVSSPLRGSEATLVVEQKSGPLLKSASRSEATLGPGAEKGPDARRRGVGRLRRGPATSQGGPDEATKQMGPYRRPSKRKGPAGRQGP